MSTVVNIVILGAYLTLLAELALLHVPSIASARNMFLCSDADRAGFSPRFRRLFDHSVLQKALLFGLPLGIIYALFAFPLIVIWQAGNPLDDELFEPGPALQLLTVIAVIAGRGITLAATIEMRRGGAELASSPVLRSSGPYRWSRNPGLVGMYLFVAGIWLAMPSALMLAAIVVYVAYMHVKVRMEEDYLENRLGQAYRDYRDRTGRYLP